MLVYDSTSLKQFNHEKLEGHCLDYSKGAVFDLDFIRKIQVNIVWLSTMVQKIIVTLHTSQ